MAKAKSKVARQIAALSNKLSSMPVPSRRRRRRAPQYANQATSAPNNRRSAPVASALSGRRMRQMGVLKPVVMSTSDLLETVSFGTIPRTAIYNTKLGPQELPPNSRGKKMAQLYSKYRCLAATIRVESAVPTSSGGQYGVFYDPNPANNWLELDAVGALTSMPVQDVAAAWECLKLIIPKSELQQDTHLYTDDATSETLVSRFGQMVILNLASPVTTPAGQAAVTVWLDATWEFTEPNASSELTTETITIPAGNWSVSSTAGQEGRITAPTPLSSYTSQTVWRLFPELPGTMFDKGEPAQFMATHTDTTIRYTFPTTESAIVYAELGTLDGTQFLASATPSSNQPLTALVTLRRFAPKLTGPKGYVNPNLPYLN